jgi:hypothetical protein
MPKRHGQDPRYAGAGGPCYKGRGQEDSNKPLTVAAVSDRRARVLKHFGAPRQAGAGAERGYRGKGEDAGLKPAATGESAKMPAATIEAVGNKLQWCENAANHAGIPRYLNPGIP